MTVQSPFLHTVSNALVRSTNVTVYCSAPGHFSWSCLRTNTISVVPLLALASHWVTDRWSSAMVGSDPLVVEAVKLVSLVFAQSDNDCIVEIIWKFALLPTTD